MVLLSVKEILLVQENREIITKAFIQSKGYCGSDLDKNIIHTPFQLNTPYTSYEVIKTLKDEDLTLGDKVYKNLIETAHSSIELEMLMAESSIIQLKELTGLTINHIGYELHVLYTKVETIPIYISVRKLNKELKAKEQLITTAVGVPVSLFCDVNVTNQDISITYTANIHLKAYHNRNLDEIVGIIDILTKQVTARLIDRTLIYY